MAPESFQSNAFEILKHFSTSGASVMIATGITHPIDVVKVKMQLEAVGQRGASIGLGKATVDLVSQEGASALYKGMYPALLRAVSYGSIRLGTYEPWKKVLAPDKERETLPRKILAGALAGSLATAVTNPMDILKVRRQGAVRSTEGALLGTLREIVQKEGASALWKGVGPSMARASMLTAAQCASYDESKHFIMDHAGIQEGLTLHLSASMMAGVIGTVFSSPFDTVKVRMMMQQDAHSDAIQHRNSLHCAYRILLTEGVRGLYKGWSANYARLGPQTAITFIVYEEMRKLVGMSGL